MVVEEGPFVSRRSSTGAPDLIKKEGQYDLGKEGGHSENRILHYKDITGWEIQRTLNEKAKSLHNIKIYEHYFAINIITQHHLGRNVTRLTPDIECYGAYALDKNTKT